MSIRSYVEELNTIQKEIKVNNTRNRFLRKRMKQLELNITEYLKSKGQNGLKYNGKAIILEKKERRPRKNKKIKEQDLVNLLEDLGVNDPIEAYKQVIEIQKGNPVENFKLKIKNLNNF